MKKYKIHIVSHTHWDREWQKTFQEYRIRLVKTIDLLLKILDSSPEYKYFTLDGQMILLEDYLEIHPENKKRLKKYIQEGRILIGPWYVQPDEFLVSGEAIIRNLMLGHKIAKRFGNIMKIGYLPDSFGHISQLPQVLSGFDINSAVFSRGIGDKISKTEFNWQAPDGSSVLAVHQISGYGNAGCLGYLFQNYMTGDPSESGLKVNLEYAHKRITEELKKLSLCSSTDNILLNNGNDHLQPQPELPKIIKYLKRELKGYELQHSSYEKYIRDVKSRARKFNVVKGELRGSKYMELLPGVSSARMHLKQKNERTQTLIEKLAEPLCSFAWTIQDSSYPELFLGQAWKYLLQCHPHDSICGCSIDEVHREMLPRFEQSQQISNLLIQQGIEIILRRIDTQSMEHDENSIPIVIFNTLNWKRTDFVETKLRIPVPDKNYKSFLIKDSKGNVVPSQITAGKISERSFSWPPEILRVIEKEIDICFIARGIPPCGYKVYTLIPCKGSKYRNSAFLSSTQITLENEFYHLRVNRDGTLKITDKETGSVCNNCNLFEDTADGGDAYRFRPNFDIKNRTTIGRKARISLIKKGLVSSTIKIETSLLLPRFSKSRKLVNCPIISWVTMYSGIKRIDISTKFINRASGHRLRVLFPTDFNSNYSYAEGQFDIVKRPAQVSKVKNWVENPVTFFPQQSFVTINNRKVGFTLINQGLPEYEVIRGNTGSGIALTLLRSISDGDARCLGEHKFNYSIVPYKGTWESAKIYQTAYQYNIPLKARQTDKHKGNLPMELSFINLLPQQLIISAIKKSEEKKSLIIRFWNPIDKELDGRLTSYKRIKYAKLVNLNEEPIKKLRLESNNTVLVKIGAHQIRTVALTF